MSIIIDAMLVWLRDLNSIVVLITVLTFLGCSNSPEVVDPKINSNRSGVFSNGESKPELVPSMKQDDNHNTFGDYQEVLVEQIIEGEKYMYAQVMNNEQSHWIATSKQKLQEGVSYAYKDGLLKTNFESKELGRVFDRIFLVSQLIPMNKQEHIGHSHEVSDTRKLDIKPVTVKGSVSIKDLIENVDNYVGKTIQVSGVCVKVNANIMGRNWLHLSDGSMDGDLLITSGTVVPKGHTVTMKGVVRKDVDFGAGYSYEILLEEGELVNPE